MGMNFSEAKENDMAPIRILLVDDEEDFRNSLSRVLRRRGFEVETAKNGEEALDFLNNNLPDLVLLDLKMDVMDGIATLEVIRNAIGDLPVIILTGHGDFNDALASIHLEVTDFFQKPVDIQKLVSKISDVLSQKEKPLLQEKRVFDLMIPVESYLRVHEWQTVSDALRIIKESFFKPIQGKETETGHRSILVFGKNESLVGLLRMQNVLEMILPGALKQSAYSSYFTGMFLAQCKILGDKPLKDFLESEELVTIDEGTPLMEAVVLMTRHCLINLPVLREGKVVGILRDRDLFLEITRNVLGE
jgi:DNA-binding response OmpR family regulator